MAAVVLRLLLFSKCMLTRMKQYTHTHTQGARTLDTPPSGVDAALWATSSFVPFPNMVEGAEVDNQLLVRSRRAPTLLAGSDLILRASLVIGPSAATHQLWQQAANRGLSVLSSGRLPCLLHPASGPSLILRPGWLVAQSCAGRTPRAPWGVAVSPVLAYRPVAIKRVSAHHGDPHVSWM